MVTRVRAAREDRTAVPRDAIKEAAEQLFAGHGLFLVSGRKTAEAAGQRNNAVAGHHFGGRTELTHATRRGGRIRRRYVAVPDGSEDASAWVGPPVRPVTEVPGSSGVPSLGRVPDGPGLDRPHAPKRRVPTRTCARPPTALGTRCLDRVPAEAWN